MIGEPLNSPYDLNFQLLGFRVRVTWLFWVVAAAFGYGLAVNMDDSYSQVGLSTPGGAFQLLIIWVAAMFASILIHELGHTLAMRYYNIDSHIVLYHLGGLAIPSSFRQYRVGGNARSGHGPAAQLIISLAGPVVQMLFGLAAILLALAFGYKCPFDAWVAPLLGVDLNELRQPPSASVAMAIQSAIYPSIAWALLNLLPVLPLDGGRIAQHSLTIYQRRDATYEATILSIIAAGLVSLWGFQTQQQFLGIMFMMLAFNNFQNLRGGISGF